MRVILPLLTMTVLFASANARAERRKPVRIAVVADGQVRAKILQIVSQHIPRPYKVVSSPPRSGQATASQTKAWADDGKLDAALWVSVVKQGRTLLLVATIIDGHSASMLFEEVIARGRLKRRGKPFSLRALRAGSNNVSRALVELSDVLQESSVEGAKRDSLSGEDSVAVSDDNSLKPPGADVGPVVTARRRSDSDPNVPHPSFSIAVGGAIGSRAFVYNDFLSGGLRDFTQGAAGLVVIDGRLQPFSKKPGDVLKGFTTFGGLTLSAGNSVAVEGGDGSDIASQWLEIRGGVGYDFRPSESITTGLAAGIDMTSFTFGAQQANDQRILEAPNTSYLSAVPAVRFAYRASVVGVEATAGVLYVLTMGKLIDRAFPRATGLGAQAQARISHPVTSWLRFGVDGRFKRYGLSMNPKPGDQYVAGGALDTFWQAGGFAQFDL